MTRFSSKLSCGVANFGIAHWPSFLRNTAPQRRDFRRAEYGDERIPEILEFLERISPINNASDISVPLSIAHGEMDSRVTVEEAIRMREIVHKNGIYTELMVCEKEGHGKRFLRANLHSSFLKYLCICVRIQTEKCDRVYQCRKDSVLGGIPDRRHSSSIVNNIELSL